MILVREVSPDGTVEFWTPDNTGKLGRLHPESQDCRDHGCLVHNPTTDWPLADAPYNWREDRHIMERLCVHGVGHPDIDGARFLERLGHAYENLHGCDGCCTS